MMKKDYIKPTMEPYDMAPVNIMAGSVTANSRIGISSFRTDDGWWSEGQDDNGNTTKKYNFWSTD